MYIHTLVCFCESRRRFSLFSPLNIYISLFFVLSLLPACLPSDCPPLLLLPCVPWLPCVVWWFPFRLPVPVACSVLSSVCSSHLARPEAIWRPSVCRSVCRLLSVTRQLSGAKRCDSVGRCTAYMSPALSPPAYVLPCVPLVVPWLVPWLPSVCPCVCPCVCPAGCRLVVIIAYTPLYPGRRRCGAASGV